MRSKKIKGIVRVCDVRFDENILSFSFEFLKDFSHVQVLFFSAVSRVISAVKRVIRALITRYWRVISAVKRVIGALITRYYCVFEFKNMFLTCLNRKTTFLVPGVFSNSNSFVLDQIKA